MAILYNATIKAARAAAFISEAGCECCSGYMQGTQPTTGGQPSWRAVVVTCLRCDHRNVYWRCCGVQCYRTSYFCCCVVLPGLFAFLKVDGTTWVSDIPVSGHGATVAGQAYAINRRVLFWLVKGLLWLPHKQISTQ